MRRIAIVEDDVALRHNYRDAMTKHGYETAAYPDRTSAMTAFRARLPDLAILDIGLGQDVDGGFTLCRELRALSTTLPIIFLSARDSDFDVVAGLRMGADDYVTKDVSLPHLLARIAALFRRVDAAREPDTPQDDVVRGDLRLDLLKLGAEWKGHVLDLTLTEFWILHSLAKNPGHVRDREALMRAANLLVDDSTITSHVKRLRRKFEAVDASFAHIDTVYGMGYRWTDTTA